MPVLAQRQLPRSNTTRPTPADWSDRQLLYRVLNHDEQAWSELVRRYRSLIYSCISKVIARFSPNMTNADVDEIYAEVLLSLLRDDMRKLRVYNPHRGTKLSSWVGMISVNGAYDFLRGTGCRPMLNRLDGLPNPHEQYDRTPLDTLLEKERWDQLNGLLEDFSDIDRTFLRLYYAQGMDAEKVATEMSITLKTVYSKKFKIRAHLLRCLETLRSNNPIADLFPATA